MKLTEQLDRTLDDLLRTTHAIPGVLHAMRDAMGGQPRAMSYEGGASVPVLYCERHEGDRADCPPEELCTGRPVDAHPDPTGDAGVEAAMGQDIARRDHRRLQRLINHHELLGREIVDLVARWQRRPANVLERKATEAANDKGNCEVCARSEVTEPATVIASTAKENLPRPYRLCRWHLDFALSYGRLPNQVEEKRHHDGARVRVRATV